MKEVFFLLMLFGVQNLFAQRVITTIERNEKTALTRADTIEYIRQKGDTCMSLLNYDLAAFYYRKILEKNISDRPALKRLKEAEYAQKRSCKNNLTRAEKLFYKGFYLQAKPFYQRIVQQGCSFEAIANERLLQIEKIMNSEKKDGNK